MIYFMGIIDNCGNISAEILEWLLMVTVKEISKRKKIKDNY